MKAMLFAHTGHWAVTLLLYVFPLVAMAVTLGVIWWRDRHRDDSGPEPPI